MKELNKVEFKKEVEDYLKVLFRKSISEADRAAEISGSGICR